MLMSLWARIRQTNRLVWLPACSAKALRDTYRGRLQRTPDGSLRYARYPLGRVRAPFDFEQLTQSRTRDRYHGIAQGEHQERG
jgi:hypothetical protein